MISTVHGNFLCADETAVIFGRSLRLHVLESTCTIPSIVVVSHRCASVIAHEMVFLVVSASEKFEGARVCIIAYCLEDHVVTFLHS